MGQTWEKKTQGCHCYPMHAWLFPITDRTYWRWGVGGCMAPILNGCQQSSENLTQAAFITNTAVYMYLLGCLLHLCVKLSLCFSLSRMWSCLCHCAWWNILFSLYKRIKGLSDPERHQNQTQSHLQRYISTSPASSTLNSGHYASFNRHDLTAQG